MLCGNIISIQPILHLMLPEIYKSAQCSSFKQDHNGQWHRNPFGGMSPFGHGNHISTHQVGSATGHFSTNE